MWRLTGRELGAMTGLTRQEVMVSERAVGEVPRVMEVGAVSVEVWEPERR
jgi:hypothetical protein